MLFRGTSIHDVEESHIRALIDSAAESKLLDFKVQLPNRTRREDKIDFLTDVTAFANASGGHLVYGVEEENGIAKAVPGLSESNPDLEMQRLSNLLNDGVDPQLPGLVFHRVGLSSGDWVLVIQIPQSWVSPHMVTLKGARPFYTRGSAGKRPLDLTGIRDAFLRSETQAERIRRFRTERLSRILAGDTPVPLHPAPMLVLHVVPLQGFSSPYALDIGQIAQTWYVLRIGNRGPTDHRLNLDGIVSYGYGIAPPTGPDSKDIAYANVWYVQVFRSGTVEAVDGSLAFYSSKLDRIVIAGKEIEATIVLACREMATHLQSWGIQFPLILCLTLLNARGVHLRSRDDFRLAGPSRVPGFDRDVVDVPEIVLEEEHVGELPLYLRPVFECLWHAAGWPQSLNYDRNGNWLGKV